MMAGLKPGKLLWSIRKNDPRDFQELLSTAQKYANAEELINSRCTEGFYKLGAKRKKGIEQQFGEAKKSKSLQDRTVDGPCLGKIPPKF